MANGATLSTSRCNKGLPTLLASQFPHRLLGTTHPEPIEPKLLADSVIPNEYGINPKQKLKIGSKIARRLLGKILIDLHNTRREVAAAAAESDIYNDIMTVSSAKRKERSYYEEVKHECVERSISNKKGIDLDDSHEETKYCLDPK
ncbi:Phosphoglycerate mutase-like family protein [Zea mays]|nr:Phosphoglycerate mutase-like family protein [Zea mays]